MDPAGTSSHASSVTEPIAAVAVSDAEQKHEAALRMQAFVRSWLCPGAGFALLGWPWWGFSVWGSIALFLFCTAWAVAQLGWLSGSSAVVTLLGSLTMWTIEQVSVFVSPIHPPRWRWFFGPYWIWTIVMTGSFLTLLVQFVLRYGEPCWKLLQF